MLLTDYEPLSAEWLCNMKLHHKGLFSVPNLPNGEQNAEFDQSANPSDIMLASVGRHLCKRTNRHSSHESDILPSVAVVYRTNSDKHSTSKKFKGTPSDILETLHRNIVSLLFSCQFILGSSKAALHGLEGGAGAARMVPPAFPKARQPCEKSKAKQLRKRSKVWQMHRDEAKEASN